MPCDTAHMEIWKHWSLTKKARTHSCYKLAQNAWKNVDTGCERAYSLDGLEVDGKEKGTEEQVGEDEHLRKGGRPDYTLFHQREGNQSGVALVGIPEAPSNEGTCTSQEEPYNRSRLPGFLVTTPLQGQEYLDGCAGKHGEANEVEVMMELGQDIAHFWLRDLVGDTSEDQEHGHETTDGEVDIETPAPGSVFGERSSNEGPAYDSKLTDL